MAGAATEVAVEVSSSSKVQITVKYHHHHQKSSSAAAAAAAESSKVVFGVIINVSKERNRIICASVQYGTARSYRIGRLIFRSVSQQGGRFPFRAKFEEALNCCPSGSPLQKKTEQVDHRGVEAMNKLKSPKYLESCVAPNLILILFNKRFAGEFPDRAAVEKK